VSENIVLDLVLTIALIIPTTCPVSFFTVLGFSSLTYEVWRKLEPGGYRMVLPRELCRLAMQQRLQIQAPSRQLEHRSTTTRKLMYVSILQDISWRCGFSCYLRDKRPWVCYVCPCIRLALSGFHPRPAWCDELFSTMPWNLELFHIYGKELHGWQQLHTLQRRHHRLFISLCHIFWRWGLNRLPILLAALRYAAE